MFTAEMLPNRASITEIKIRYYKDIFYISLLRNFFYIRTSKNDGGSFLE